MKLILNNYYDFFLELMNSQTNIAKSIKWGKISLNHFKKLKLIKGFL